MSGSGPDVEGGGGEDTNNGANNDPMSGNNPRRYRYGGGAPMVEDYKKLPLDIQFFRF
jgi:hypothetical protein